MKKLIPYLQSRKFILIAVALCLFLAIQLVFIHTSGGDDETRINNSPKSTIEITSTVPSFVKNVVIADQKIVVRFPELETTKKSLQITPLPKVSDGAQASIIIIIDDVGMNLKYSKEVTEFDVPLTLAFLPYAPKAQEFIATALQNGHEAIVHMPMEPMDVSVNAGEDVLKTDMSEAEIRATLDVEFTGLEGISGLNNHMGSKFTQNKKGLSVVMDYLKEKNLFFVDSRTIGNSVAGSVAKEKNVPTLDRDIFLDHEENPEFVRKALVKLESKAKENGHAVAIGHPKKVTLDALRVWIPDAQKRGFKIVRAGDFLKSIAAEKHANRE